MAGEVDVEVPSGGECNGVSKHREEGLVHNENGNANWKREVNESHVFVNGSDGVGGSDGDRVEADLGEENVASSIEKDSVGEDDELKVENGVNGNCSLEVDPDGDALEQEEPGRGSAADTSATEEQNRELAQGSTIGAESEKLSVDAAVAKSGTVESEDQVQRSIADAESKGVQVDVEVTDRRSSARDQNVTVVSRDQEQESTDGAESEGLLVDGLVEETNIGSEQNGTVESKDQVQGSITDDESEGVRLNAEVTDSSSAGEQDVTVVTWDQEQGITDGAESEGHLLDATESDSRVCKDLYATMASKDQVQGSIADTESEGLLDGVAMTDGGAAEKQNGTVVSNDQVQWSIGDAESGGLLADSTVTDSSAAGEHDRSMVPDKLVLRNIAPAESEGLLVDAAITDDNVTEEENGAVVSEGQGQGKMEAAADPEGCLVDAGDENSLGLIGQLEESKNETVVVVVSEPAGCVGREMDTVTEKIEVKSSEDGCDTQVSKALGLDVTNCGCGDCKAPLLDAGKLANGEESNFDSAEQVEKPYAGLSEELLVGDEKVCDGNENQSNSSKQMEEIVESEITVQNPIEVELSPLNGKIDTSTLTEKPDTCGDVQTIVVNGGFVYDHPKEECAEVVALLPCDDHSNRPVETSGNSFENKLGQPGDADALSSDNVLEEANNVDVDTMNVSDIESPLSKIDTSTLTENAKDGEAQPVEATTEVVEEESKDRVVQVTEGKTNEEGEALPVESTTELVGETLQGSKNGEKPDLEDTDVQHAEAKSELNTMESVEPSDVSNGSAEAQASVDQIEATEIETEVGEMVQPADADSESFCSPSGPPVEKKPFYFMIRIPRYDDNKLREEIALSQLKVVEKTKIRDAIMAEIQPERIIFRDLRKTFQDFASEQKKLRDLLRSKRQEIDSQQFLMNKVRDAMSMDDIDEKIRNIKNTIEHESVPLKEEKQYVREMEKLKQAREDLSSNMSRQEEIQHSLKQKDEIEKQLKLLRKEVDPLREKFNKAQNITTDARKKLDDQNAKLKRLEAEYRNADQCRQQEYSHLQSLWEALNEKNKYFRKYKDDVRVAYNYASVDKEALQQHCVNQVESFMELWNKNDEFRTEYVNCNLRSTLRRLTTHDGRSLGPDEEPPIIPNAIYRFNNKTSATVSTPEEEKVQEAAALPVESHKSKNANREVRVTKKQNDVSNTKVSPKNKADELKPGPVVSNSTSLSGRNMDGEEANEEVIVTKKQKDVSNTKVSQKNKAEKLKPPVVGDSTSLSGRNMDGEEANEEVIKVVEDEMARQAEVLRKEEEASRLEEQLRLEQKAKAKEALERKKRMAEKAQARAEFRAKKEQEKKDKKMEKKKATVLGTSNQTNDGEQTSRETSVVTAKESEHQEKPTAVTKRSSKPLRFTKSKPIPPPPLRNRGKRRMQSWMWFLISALLVFALFLLGSSDILSKLGLQKFVN